MAIKVYTIKNGILTYSESASAETTLNGVVKSLGYGDEQVDLKPMPTESKLMAAAYDVNDRLIFVVAKDGGVISYKEDIAHLDTKGNVNNKWFVWGVIVVAIILFVLMIMYELS